MYQKPLPTLKSARDLSLSGTKRKTFTPNIPSKREMPSPSKSLTGTPHKSKLNNKQFKSNNFDKNRKPQFSTSFNSSASRKNYVVTSSIFSCGLADKALPKKTFGYTSSISSSTADKSISQVVKKVSFSSSIGHSDKEQSESYDDSDSEWDEYTDDIFTLNEVTTPMFLPFDENLNKKTSSEPTKVIAKDAPDSHDMLSLWTAKKSSDDSKIELETPKSMLDASNNQTTAEARLATAAEMLSSNDGKAKIIFLQLPSTLPVVKPVNTETEKLLGKSNTQSNTTNCANELYKLGRPELSSLKHLPEGKLGQLNVHKSGKISMKIGEAIFNLTVGTPTTFLQELAVIEHTAGLPEGDLTHLGYVSGRMICTPDIEHLSQTHIV